MRPDDGAVDHLQAVRDTLGVVQRLQQQVPKPRKAPAPELAVDRRPLAEVIRQVAPRRPGPRDPENPIQNKAMILRGAAPPRSSLDHKGRKERPLLVAHQSSDQATLPPKGILNHASGELGILFVNTT